MQALFIIVLVIAIPIVLFPVAFVWYINIGVIYAAIKEAKRKRAEQAEQTRKNSRNNKVALTNIPAL